jgi:hypothetical protein
MIGHSSSIDDRVNAFLPLTEERPDSRRAQRPAITIVAVYPPQDPALVIAASPPKRFMFEIEFFELYWGRAARCWL